MASVVIEDDRLLGDLTEDGFGLSQWAITATDEEGLATATTLWINVLADNDAPRGAVNDLRLTSLPHGAFGEEHTRRLASGTPNPKATCPSKSSAFPIRPRFARVQRSIATI